MKPEVKAVRLWVERVVIGLSLCPWARPIHDRNALRFTHSDAVNADDLFESVLHEMDALQSTERSHDSTVLVAPQYSPDDFLAFNEFVQDAEAYLRRADLDDTFQLVAFHPQFCFAGENPDDASNYVNRAPHPAIHLLLQDDVTAAVDSHPNSLEVPQINKKELRKLGVAQMRRLVSDARRDAGDPTMMVGSEPVRCVIIGGTGRIGTAVASHLLSISDGNVQVVLAGRDEGKGGAALDEILSEATKGSVEFVMCDFRDSNDLKALLDGAAAVVHTAGPYAGEEPLVLKAAIDCKVPVYVDLSDPIDYLDAAKAIGQAAAGASETIALCAAGAFPGLSNVLAMECADQLNEPVKDVDFSYFTAGLGGSGEVNLYITNEGFGEPVPVYRNGEYAPQMESGANTRKVEFFLEEGEPSQKLVGERDVWSWPFPEGALVAKQLGITGSSSVGMGTAPGIWNDVMGIMVDVIPREWWSSPSFSKGLAQFSRPLVFVTDLFVGETHAMRIDVTSATSGARVSAVQAHESFRRTVGMSCAEFTLALLASRGLQPVEESGCAAAGSLPLSGVFTPEMLFAEREVRKPMLARLLSLPGTLNAGLKRVG